MTPDLSDLPQKTNSLRLADIAVPAEIIDDSASTRAVERRLMELPELTCVVIRSADGELRMLTRRSLAMTMAGPLGYGRALHAHRPIATTMNAAKSLMLPGDCPIVDAGVPALSRAKGQRYDDILVLPEDKGSPIGTVSIAGLFASLAATYEHRASHDPLTELANRSAFVAAVAEAIAEDNGEGVAVLFVDLDDFKAVNDSLGHLAGDDLLSTLAQRMRGAFREIDRIGRFGGDEFAVLLRNATEETARKSAERLQLLIGHPIEVGGHTLRVRASVGVSLHGSDDSAETMLRNADLAMYEAKSMGKGCHTVYRPTMHERAVIRLELETDVGLATRLGQLRLQYQPVIALAEDRVVAVEALVRWEHPKRGLVTPLDFLPTAERSGAIVEIGEWVLTEACRQVEAWDEAGAQRLSLNVNVSIRQLENERFLPLVKSTLEACRIDPSRLILEITESALAFDPDLILERLNELAATGVCVAIDDFGTGYSSFSRLEGLPIGMLKIDRSFTSRLAESGASRVMQGMLSLADAMEVSAVVEGVETGEQAALLRDMGCQSAQGYLFSRPLTPEDLETLVLEPFERNRSAVLVR